MIGRVLWILFILLGLTVQAQPDTTVKIDVKNKPLNEVLHQLRDQYGFQLSYTENELSKYRITAHKAFDSHEETLTYLLDSLPFKLKKTGEVFIIIPLKTNKEGDQSDVQISGQIVESETWEPLSYSNIIINKKKLVADVTGSFNFIA